MPKIPELERVPAAAARRRKAGRQIELLLPFGGNKIPAAKGDFVDPRFLEIG